VGCEDSTTINLQGLACLRYLELKSLRSLKTLAYLRRSGEYFDLPTTFIKRCTHSTLKQFSHPSLQYVIIDRLSSLEHLPPLQPTYKFSFSQGSGLYRLDTTSKHSTLLKYKTNVVIMGPKSEDPIQLGGTHFLTEDLTIRSIDMTNTGSALKLEGLSCLISLGALDLFHVPVVDLSDLENLTRVEYVSLVCMLHLTSLLHLQNLLKSSLHMLEVRD